MKCVLVLPVCGLRFDDSAGNDSADNANDMSSITTIQYGNDAIALARRFENHDVVSAIKQVCDGGNDNKTKIYLETIVIFFLISFVNIYRVSSCIYIITGTRENYKATAEMITKLKFIWKLK